MEHRWHILGPGGGGALYHPTVSPHDNRIVMIGCDMTNSFLTTDGGESWAELNFHGNARAFACDPDHPGVLYAGSLGLFRSDDSGRNWRLLFPKPETVTLRYSGDHAYETLESADWPGGQVVGIATGHGELWVGVNTDRLTLFRSTDGGANFTAVGELPQSELLRLWLVKPGEALAVSSKEICHFNGGRKEQIPLPDGRELLDASVALDKATGKPVIYAATGSRWESGVFRTGLYRHCEETGWSELSGGLECNLAPDESRNINRVAACAGDGSTVYASIREPANGETTKYFGILKSRDAGSSWQWVLRMDESQPENRATGWVEQDYDTCWAGAPFWMGVSPNNPDLVYATDWGTVYKTNDGGQFWQQLYTYRQPGGWASRGIDVTNVYEPAFDPWDKNHMLLPCTDIGLFASHDGGKSWAHSEAGVPKQWSNTCYCALYDPSRPGRAWSAWSNCHDLPRQKMLRGGNLGRYQGGVCISDDGGNSWQASNQGMPANSPVTHLAIDPGSKPDCRILVAAVFGKGVFKSTDDGKTWALKNKGIEGNPNAWRLCFAPDGTLYLLVAGDTAGGTAIDGALYRSGDCGEHWQRLPLPEGVFYGNDIAIGPGNPARLYLACWGSETGFPARRGGLHVSEDGGQSWQLILNGSLHIYGITVWPHNPGVLYATAYEGFVFRSEDCGKSWETLPGYDFKWPKAVVADPYDSGMLYLSTFGSCLWHGPAAGAAKEFGIVRIP